MKIIKIVLLLSLSLVVFSCSDDDREAPRFKQEELPTSAQEFLNEYFAGIRVKEIRGSYTWNAIQQSYVVTLDENIEIYFDMAGCWEAITAEKGMPESATKLIDRNVLSKLKEKEPQAKMVVFTSITINTILMKLDNRKEYGQCSGLEGIILGERIVWDSSDDCPKEISDFMKRNSLDSFTPNFLTFKFDEGHGDIYHMCSIDDAMTLTFNKEGRWIHTKVNFFSNSNTTEAEAIVNKITENEIPKNIMDVIKDTQSNLGSIHIISVYGDGYYGFRFKNKDLLINDKIGIIPVPIKITDKLIADYFDNSLKIYKPEGMNIVGPYEFTYGLKYENKDYDVDIYIDSNGKWIHVEAYFIKDHKEIGVNLPIKFIEAELPAKMVDYLKENYKDAKISRVYYLGNEYAARVNDKDTLYFGKDGTYRYKIGGTIETQGENKTRMVLKKEL